MIGLAYALLVLAGYLAVITGLALLGLGLDKACRWLG